MRGLLLGLVSVVLSALGAVACTTANPEYDGTGTSSEPQQGTTALTTAAQGSSSAADDASSGEPTCELHDPRPLRLELTGELVPPLECDGGSVTLSIPPLPDGRNQYEMLNTVEHCESAECGLCTTTARTARIELANDVVFAEGVPLPECGKVELWSHLDRATGECQWAGVALYEGDDWLPSFIASRTLEFWINGIEFELELDPQGEPCRGTEPCDGLGRSPGRYSLRVLDQHTIEVQDAPQPLTVSFSDAGLEATYLFHDRMSSVTPDCRLALAWTAQLQQ